jgi:hypothetical protein
MYDDMLFLFGIYNPNCIKNGLGCTCLLRKDNKNKYKLQAFSLCQYNLHNFKSSGRVQWVYEVIVKSIEVDAQFKSQICRQ